MPFIGVQPASALLTSADIQDGQITTAKIANDAVDNTKLDLTSSYDFSAGLTLGDNLTFDVAGKGVHLGVTSATASNLMDDYEEGDWTPAVYSGGWGLSTSMARYTKVGRLVTVMTDMSLTGSGNSSDLIISGLPFTNSTNGYASGAGYMNTYPSSPNNHFTPMVDSNATIVYFQNGNGAYYNGNQFSAGYFNFNVTYFV